VILESDRRDKRGDYSEEGSKIYTSRGNALVPTLDLRFVANVFQNMLEVVGNEIHAHEKEKHRHGEPSEYLCALQPIRDLSG
jgi:hypothetical protein